MIGRRAFAILLVVMFGTWAVPACGQTCSCAGAPLISSQSTGASSAGNMVLGATYEYHDISALYSGSTRLENSSVARTTQSVLLEASYGLTGRLSASGTFTYVGKSRATGLRGSDRVSTTNTRGIGDGLFLLRYVIFQQTLWQPYHLAVGVGGKIPFGTTSLTENGLALNADMQPGTGAWDGVLWSYGGASFLPYTTIQLSWFNTYRHTGKNARFAEDDRYMFGNEFVSTLGISDRLIGDISYSFRVRYRSTSSDQLNGIRLPNTGGKWVSVVPMLNIPVFDPISLQLAGRMPLYQHLRGTQPTTSYAVRATFFINLNSDDNAFTYGSEK